MSFIETVREHFRRSGLDKQTYKKSVPEIGGHWSAAVGRAGLLLALPCERLLQLVPNVFDLSFRIFQGARVVDDIIGVTSFLLRAPIAMQIVHLLVADLVWVVFVLLGAAALSEGLTTSPAGPSLASGSEAVALGRSPR